MSSRNFILESSTNIQYILSMKRKIFVLVFLFAVISCFCFGQLPKEYYQFRDDMYNFAKSPEEMEVTGAELLQKADKELSGYEKYLAKARYEFILGRVWFYQNNNEKAGQHYDKGIEYADLAIKEKSDAQSQLIYAENISANCAVKPVSYVLIWGVKISPLTKKVLDMDSKNGAAFYMQNAQDVYAPAPFNNHKRGIKKMSSLLDNPNVVLDKDDKFNVLSSIGYANMQLKKYSEAIKWLEDSLKIYPGNKYVQSLIEECKKLQN